MSPFAGYTRKSVKRVMGLMSGTSADAVDAVLVELAGHGRKTYWRILHHTAHPLPQPLRECILALSASRTLDVLIPVAGDAPRVALVDAWIARVFAEAVFHCLTQAGRVAADIDLIASHGQTVCHLPDGVEIDGIPVRTTLQLGKAAIIAAKTGLPVVSDFRTADFALGGQGAPLVPFADWVLFSVPGRIRAVQNLGGIGNVTYLPGADLAGVAAFDTGPANMLVDAAMRRITAGKEQFDRDGAIARTGKVSSKLMAELLKHPFLLRQPPKSTGHEDFGEIYLAQVMERSRDLRLSGADLVATLTAVGPEAAVAAYHRFLPRFPDEIILGGGGSHNPVVVEHFRRLCGEAILRRLEEFGIPSQAKEGLAFALLANETMHGSPSNVPAATGASGPAILGCTYLPPPGATPGRCGNSS